MASSDIDIRTATLKQPIDIAEYLFRRLHQVGVRTCHGVPGDYNLVALDYLEPCGLQWAGNCNELNAGYAADGYARIKGISAMMTTFGVGELSALNAVAGAFAEYVPLVHIVGTPSTLSQANGMLLHHTLGNGNFRVFSDMSSNISCTVAQLNDPMTAANLVDHVLRECYLQSRPVYLTLPTDSVKKKVEGERLNTPLDLNYPPNDEAQEEYVVDEVLRYLHAAERPIILVDACAIRHRALGEVHDLITKTNLPTFVAPMGKSAVDETLPNYIGVYAGNGSHDSVRSAVESSDLVLSIGAIKSDFNTAGFTYHTSQLNTIDFHSHMVKVKYAEYHSCRMNGVLQKVTQRVDLGKLSVKQVSRPEQAFPSTADEGADQVITQGWFWPRVSDFIREGDVVITETGTSSYGIWEVAFKKKVKAISQILWGSIGYATGACQGAALAAKEIGEGRTMLFTGDGSFQLTAQELSTMSRLDLNPILFIICNEGYTIERFIHGMDAKYNDIAPWRYRDLVSAFGAAPGSYKTYQAKTKRDVEGLFKDEDFATADCLRFVELYMKKEDAPKTLQMTAEASARNNARM